MATATIGQLTETSSASAIMSSMSEIEYGGNSYKANIGIGVISSSSSGITFANGDIIQSSYLNTNDGNAGHIPAPKPRTATDSDIGHIKSLAVGTSTAFILPAGGRWAYFVIAIVDASNTISGTAAGENAGGTSIAASNPAIKYNGIVWRIS